MNSEQALREKLRKIEALFAGGATDGEKAAAGAAADRIQKKLSDLTGKEEAVEIRFSLPDPWSRQLFIALCRRYNIRPYRYPRMKQQSIVIKAPKSFIDDVIWLEFKQLNAALSEYLAEVTDKIIKEEVFGETSDAETIKDIKAIK